ncbi:MAG: alpha/beta hydrolase [Kiritimatiellae bacterium]|nr:alpha/beta hydrolase [Kiritimatiellia bacterium]
MAGCNNTPATSVGPGDAVYVEGTQASTYIGGDKILWQWTENGETQVRTNVYTIFSLRMFADLNLDNAINSNDYAGVSSLTLHGWVMPVASNAFRKVQLKNDVNFTGNRTLTLSGNAAVRVWTTATPSTNDTPLLVAGQTATNGIDGADFAGYPERMIYVEAIGSGYATLSYNYVGTGEYASGLSCEASLSMNAVRFGLIPNYNRDEFIGVDDSAMAATNAVFHFWVNDDDDDDFESGCDLPDELCSGLDMHIYSADCDNGSVDNERDMVDFLGKSGFDYVLRHEDDALNAVITECLPLTTDEDLRPTAYLNSTNFVMQHKESDVEEITSEGYILSDEFLDTIVDDGGGIILLEGAAETDNPLILEIRETNSGKVVARSKMNLNLSMVEKMFRHVNIRNDEEGRTMESGEPDGYPDSLCSDKNLLFVHGFNINETEARGWQCEIYKKLFHAGNNARFWGVTWEGDVNWPNGLYYHNDAANAFVAASNLNVSVSSLNISNITIMGHSLGNMVVSSAIADHGMEVDRYFMLNAAVAAESYHPALFNTATNSNPMVSDEWGGYEPRTWSALWHELFIGSDNNRTNLTWKNRFGPVLDVAYNFYSSGDEIFEINPNNSSNTL